jgi:hypothetical protein
LVRISTKARRRTSRSERGSSSAERSPSPISWAATAVSQVGDHVLERGAGAAELVARADVHVLLEVADGDALGGPLHGADARGDLPREPEGDADAGEQGEREQHDRELALRVVLGGDRLVLRLPELDLRVEQRRERLGDAVEDRPDLAGVVVGRADHRLRVGAGVRDRERLPAARGVFLQPAAQRAQRLMSGAGPDRRRDAGRGLLSL